MLDDRIAKLSDVQKRCLRLTAEGRSSKEIAPLVGLTHQTVDQYLHRARMILNAENRREAARIFVEIDRAVPFKQFELKPTDVEIREDAGISEEPVERRQAQPKSLGLPPIGGPTNDLTRTQRLMAIGRIALFLTIIVLTVIILFAAALDALSR
ncbi:MULTISPECIES: helix-turn-helix transcriptional regulator [unclassified Sphingobium]|uniref:helix-turn-helix domain-containing protein n=1 Tax=unclassified Sphingobium TaxID=2611147 RepID=UPI0005D9E52C|nr:MULTISPECIES: helix-turn-helix transcriptional regulator [unclassified Sphingobium]AJR23412.1 LuxR family transcriptional regulator [Sphingobium sp. YBL2]PNP95775.1 helix-turn-helix transcriptional regulator [Sphingobium sp. SA916]